MWAELFSGLEMVLRPDTVAMTAAGLLLGIAVGSLPGFTTVMAMAVLLPISFFLDPLVGIPFLIGVYKGGIYGGSIPAILIGVPGTGASVATTYDGPALARKGKSKKALEMALYASVFGDTASSLLTILMIGPIALVAMRIGPPELAVVLAAAMAIIAVTASGPARKGILMLGLGCFVALVGQDPVHGVNRFTFDLFALQAGIDLLPLIIGLFAIPEILLAVEGKPKATPVARPEGESLTMAELRASGRTILRSTAIGAGIGAIPGVGQVVAAFMGYAAARRAARDPSTFGHGDLDGVAAPEAANNAVNGPTMVPLLTLGIPGDNVTAILLGAFVAQGLRPGPQLFATDAATIYALLFSMVIACILLLVLGRLTIPLFAKVVAIPRAYMVPLTLVFAVAGTYVYRSNPMDLVVLMGFGLFGYAARKMAFDVTPMVMGFLLIGPFEYAVSQTLSLSRGDLVGYVVAERPVTLILLALIAAGLAFIALRRRGPRTPVQT
ncbi:tripartite tricarboxylate transporter permease [Jannaschia aquimarina]|uniref:Tripartite tricarboxylate transporter TctA family protein n=1 Tax=Jannaschia aquimarina TaxID=935700 RepID=A0A0D1EKN9_9RHOB|nr:tripartite tricarboxylate transporter permease [Jannaschia aquimarina]KIT17576.1 Tripartite tricarboxylate transporter TctA family protein [Jannaschia aquimarina]SNS72408.1 putative tricarboxylic transport membrane protein [Jannaschia aquimarina]